MIQDKAMLVSLKVSTWNPRKYDRQVTADVEEHYNSKDSGRFNKQLINMSDLKEITEVISELRTYHYYNTLPWLDNGTRVLPSTLYFEYTQKIASLKNSFDNAVRQFVNNYTNVVESAKTSLGLLYKPEDYPTEEQLKSKFEISTIFLPIPTADDFRVDINDTEMQTIKANLEKEQANMTNEIVISLWERLKEVVSTMHTKLDKDDAIFRNSLVENVRTLCKTLPSLNVTQDQNLIDISTEVIDLLDGINADDIRADGELRKEIALDTKNIIEKMAAYKL